jgi:hypothetical protein
LNINPSIFGPPTAPSYLDPLPNTLVFTANQLLLIWNQSLGTEIQMEGFREMMRRAEDARVLVRVTYSGSGEMSEREWWRFTDGWVERRKERGGRRRED